MPRRRPFSLPDSSVVCLAVFVCVSSILVRGQAGNPQSPSASAAQTGAQPAPPIKATTRLVSLEVVARDRQGRPVRGLTAKDFEVSEQILEKKDRHAQSVSVFREVNWAELKAATQAAPTLPAGIYSNLTNRAKIQVPPTVLLFDGINTNRDAQLEVHRQMAKILTSIPADVPIAVFLMGDRLQLLQTFTTDPKLVREAAAKTLVAGRSAPDEEPTDNPDALSAHLEGDPHLPSGFLESLEAFEKGTYWFEISIRMQKTLDAFRNLANYLNGYPGRKNILWISTSFPLELDPGSNASSGNFADLRSFLGDMQDVGSALMDGKIAIYPVDAGGVQTQSMYEASARVRQSNQLDGMGEAMKRESTHRQASEEVMQDLADQTGGRVCLSDNDFADCVKKAVDDASSYYEIAYYPTTGDWRGEYHRIEIKTARPGIHLWYREGYYAEAHATDAATDGGKSDAAIQRAACEDPLPSTAILLMAQSIPPDQPGAAKYFLAMDSHMLTFRTAEADEHALKLTIAACTFDKTGKPVEYYHRDDDAKLNDQEFRSASHAVTQTFQFVPQSGVARVRLLVRDAASGRIGSVDLPYAETRPPTPPVAAPGKP